MLLGWESLAPLDLTELSQACKRAENYQQHLYGLQKKLKRNQKRVETQAEDLGKKATYIGDLEDEIAHLMKESEVMMSKMTLQAEGRVEDRKQLHSLKAKLKNHGIIPDDTRSLINDLIAKDGVNPERVLSVLNRMADHLRVPVEGSVSDQSTKRIVLEGGAAAKMQVVQCIKNAKGLTISGDGTTHKNNNLESHHATTQFFLGIQMAVNHTSETQLEGWVDLVDDLYSIYKHSSHCQSGEDARDFWIAVTGMHTDHAEDQKKLFQLLQTWKQRCECEKRGEETILKSTPHELLDILFKVSQEAIINAGGMASWENISQNERKTHHDEAFRRFAFELGEAEFAKLDDSQKKNIDLLIWAGCCMYKEMNAFKGGCTHMSRWWEENGVSGPIKMYNRDNAAAADLAAGTAAAKRAEDRTQGGAIKVSSLAGAQDTLRYFWDLEMGFTLCFPNTSNTRFQSHAEACAIIITYLDLILQFLSYCNVKHGCEDNATQHEFAAIGVPYMREICGPLRSPLHEKVKSHLHKIIADSDLLLSQDMSYETGSLDGKLWEMPEAIYALPHLSPLLTWERFTSEFLAGGAIDTATSEQIESAWMESTNDLNEAHIRPNMSLNYFNALQIYLKSLTSEEHTALQKLVCDQDSSGNNHAIKHTMAQHMKDVASQNADKDCTRAARIARAEEAIDGCDPYWTSQALEEAYKIQRGANGYLTVAALDLQLDWHIKNGKNGSGLEIPKAKSGAKGRGD
ncbi:hypothetical protein ARMGADRAFT_1047959 [Armillaria gallica]|uniref:Uncharacterized protein n=1 Tax=Armillaria gallica TaxID=47427 RepID=A0A2H3CS30_ARMGA|nr:hypothetical protein ARMGADRAFT_1047959 [Armillaria gallica]